LYGSPSNEAKAVINGQKITFLKSNSVQTLHPGKKAETAKKARQGKNHKTTFSFRGNILINVPCHSIGLLN